MVEKEDKSSKEQVTTKKCRASSALQVKGVVLLIFRPSISKGESGRVNVGSCTCC